MKHPLSIGFFSPVDWESKGWYVQLKIKNSESHFRALSSHPGFQWSFHSIYRAMMMFLEGTFFRSQEAKPASGEHEKHESKVRELSPKSEN